MTLHSEHDNGLWMLAPAYSRQIVPSKFIYFKKSDLVTINSILCPPKIIKNSHVFLVCIELVELVEIGEFNWNQSNMTEGY